VGIGECKVSGEAEVELMTYALGSCIAVSIWDSVARVGGLLHFMLPDSSIAAESDRAQWPFRYADTGIPLLFREAYRLGADKKRLVVRVAGGAAVVDDGGMFNIGKKNYAALRKILWRAGVMIHGEEVGGAFSRNVRLEVGSGRLVVSGGAMNERELPAGRRTLDGEAVCANAC
jgi:chemotaxis protein CheD